MTKESKKTDWGKILLVLILGVLVWNTWEILKLGSISARVDKYNQGVVDEVGSVTGDVKMFAEDLNEIRRFLLLPEKSYFNDNQNGENSTGDTEEQIGSEDSQAVFAMLDGMVKDDTAAKNTAQAQTAYDALMKNQDFLSKIAAAGLQPGERSSLQVKFQDNNKTVGETQENVFYNQPLYNLVFSGYDNVFVVQSALGEEKFTDYSSADFPGKLSDYLIKNITTVRNKKSEDKKQQEAASAKEQDAANVANATRKKDLDDIVHDQAFTDTLASMGLKISEKPKEENNKYFYEVTDTTGKVRFSLALEISSGMIKLIKDNQETDIRNFLDPDGSKKKP